MSTPIKIADDAFDHYPYTETDREIVTGKFDSEKHVLKQRILQLEAALEKFEMTPQPDNADWPLKAVHHSRCNDAGFFDQEHCVPLTFEQYEQAAQAIHTKAAAIRERDNYRELCNAIQEKFDEAEKELSALKANMEGGRRVSAITHVDGSISAHDHPCSSYNVNALLILDQKEQEK